MPTASFAFADRLDAVDEIRDLAGAEHVGMAGQDLLDQGRPRTRHAEDEDRHRGGAAETAPGVDELAGEDGDDEVEDGEPLGLVIRDLPADQRIPRLPLGERPAVVFEIVVGLAEREMQIGLRVLRQPGHVGRQRLHCRQMRVISDVALDIGESTVFDRASRCERQRGLERALRLRQRAQR